MNSNGGTIREWQPVLFLNGPSRFEAKRPVSRSNYEVVLSDSIYLLPSLEGEGFVIYDPFGGQTLTISKAQGDLLMSRVTEPKAMQQLLISLLGKPFTKAIATETQDSYAPTSVALMLTSACQLRCGYCYAEAGATPTAHLSAGVAHAAISIVAANAKKTSSREFTVHFHGAGEPTLRPNLITDALKYIKAVAAENSVTGRSILTTNFCIAPNIAVHYAKVIDRIFVSCDGTPDVSDISRPMANKEISSGNMIEAALSAVQSANLAGRLVVRCTVTRASQSRLTEFTQYFANFGIKNIYFVPVSSLGRGHDIAAVEPSCYVHEFLNAQSFARQLGVRLHHPGTDIEQLRPDGFGCGIRGTNFSVLPDGDVSLCYEAVVPASNLRKIFKVGEFRADKFAIDTERIKDIASATHVKKRTVCSSCFCRATCAGQCAARNITTGINIRDAPMTDACDITRAITRIAIDQIPREI